MNLEQLRAQRKYKMYLRVSDGELIGDARLDFLSGILKIAKSFDGVAVLYRPNDMTYVRAFIEIFFDSAQNRKLAKNSLSEKEYESCILEHPPVGRRQPDGTYKIFGRTSSYGSREGQELGEYIEKIKPFEQMKSRAVDFVESGFFTI